VHISTFTICRYFLLPDARIVVVEHPLPPSSCCQYYSTCHQNIDREHQQSAKETTRSVQILVIMMQSDHDYSRHGHLRWLDARTRIAAAFATFIYAAFRNNAALTICFFPRQIRIRMGNNRPKVRTLLDCNCTHQ
jgi:hypothetical protein